MQCSDIVYEPDVLLLNSSWYASRFLGYLLAKLLARSSANTAAVVRTTVGVTRMNAGTADNVLPDNGAVLFNFRLLPGQEPVLCCAVLCCAGYQVCIHYKVVSEQRFADPWLRTCSAQQIC
jgi:hypothetical protein